MLPTLYNNNRINSFVDNIEQQWHKLVDNFFAAPHVSDLKNKLKMNSGYPRLDVFTTDKEYCIQASVPGVNPENLAVETFTEDDVRYLRLSGQMSEEVSYKDENCIFRTRELRRGSFARTIALPEDLEGDPDARIKDGIVTLTWQIKPPKSPPDVKQIQLKKE